MASPFSIFRKHQKMMIAGLAVMAMIAFVFLSGVPTDHSSRGPQNPVVVTTAKFGKLRTNDVQGLLRQRQGLLGFLRSLKPAIQQAGGEPGRVEGIIRMIGPATEQAVVERWLFAQQAEKMGIAVNDKVINGFLSDVASPLSGKDIEAILSRQRSGISEPQLFAILRQELLALRLRQLSHQLDSAQTAFSMVPQMAFSVPPGQRWDYYLRLHREAQIEAVAVPVERYVDKVPDPSQVERKQFFEEYKDVIPRPDSPEPGFHVPQKVDMQYLKAERAKFLASVSDAEVRAEYDRSKKQYDKEEQEYEEAERKAEAEQPAKPAPEKKAEPGEKPLPAGKPGSEKKPEPKQSVLEPKTEPQKPPPPEKPLSKKEAEPAAKAEAKELPEPPKKPDEHKGAGRRLLPPLRLVSFADETPGDVAKPPASPAAEKDKPAGQPAEKSATEKPAAEKPATEKAGAEKPAAEKPATGKSPAKEQPPATSHKPPATTRERPSTWLKDRIRGKLADAKIRTGFAEIQDVMSQYHSRWTRYDADQKRDIEGTPPTPPDFVALAKRHHLVYAKTGLVAELELVQTDLGKSFMWISTDEVRGMMPAFIARHAYETKTLFMPERSQDSDGNQYLFWKTQDDPDRVPSLDDEDVQAEVLRAWKMIEARKLARQSAEALRSEAARAKRPLKEVFADRPELKVIRPEPFAWLTTGHVPTESLAAGMWLTPRLSPVDKQIPAPGTEFMQTVFDMSAGDVGVAMNQPQTAAYVIHLVAFTPSEQELQKVFEEDDPFYQIRELALDDQKRIDQAWQEEMMKAAGFKWQIKPSERLVAPED
jgi:hypothetical protein